MNNHIVDGLLRESSETLWTSTDRYNRSAMSVRIYNRLVWAGFPDTDYASSWIKEHVPWRFSIEKCFWAQNVGLGWDSVQSVVSINQLHVTLTGHLSLNWHVQHLTWTQPPRTSGRCSFKRHVVDSTVACRQRIWDWIPAVISVWESGPSSLSVGESSHDKSLVVGYTIFSE